MKTRLVQSDAFSVALIAGTAALTLRLYDRLPQRIATHFDLHGVPNGWMPRVAGAWVLPIASICALLLLRLGAKVLPAPWRNRMHLSPFGVASVLVVALLSACQCVLLYAAIKKLPSVGAPLALALAGFWIALGLILPRIRRNPWMGVRTAWTLSSDENWARTHRLAGFTFFIGGVLALFSAGAGSSSFSLLLLVASALIPRGYSLVVARHLSDS